MSWLRKGFKNQLMHEMKCCFILMVGCHLMHSFKLHIDWKLEDYYHLVDDYLKTMAVCQSKTTASVIIAYSSSLQCIHDVCISLIKAFIRIL